MKKLLYALLFTVLLCGCSSARMKMGFLTKLNITEDEFEDAMIKNRKAKGWQLLDFRHDDDDEVAFYDSLMEMQMALTRGDIDEAALPKPVAEYVLNTNSEFTVSSVEHVSALYLSCGFSEKRGSALRDKFNKALSAMKDDGTLSELHEEYLSDPGEEDPDPVKIEHFDGAGVFRVAVTGDIPPIDFVAEDDSPAGFNTAVCAEIGRRLHLNVEIIDIDAGARAAALASGRVDVVFWYATAEDTKRQIDVPDGILLSEPYYKLDKFLFIKKK